MHLAETISNGLASMSGSSIPSRTPVGLVPLRVGISRPRDFWCQENCLQCALNVRSELHYDKLNLTCGSTPSTLERSPEP